jgi:DNA-binding NarL/FixJ family response regulator
MKNLDKVKSIILAKESKLHRKYFSELLNSNGFKVAGFAGSEVELFQLLKINKPDILIYDLFLTSNGLENSIRRIIETSPETKLIVTGEDYSVLIESAIATGASGFFDEDILDLDLILDAIKRIGLGETVILTRESVF